ncbi:hypothetical protein L249_7381 [Ophiocordyceps polyrhachis-furcata BCC 54312]|uniref:Uncharacterized protein n=1 Tax=Ophiocordyceps polyrhachis-furcata BCC 54312 TaxID=1330021 RepID=A0A367LBG4_9HYPO|nr:hypothetical protein L249_7381 [Ophiocordyceps polyrhachis-furcata BCC 54312]
MLRRPKRKPLPPSSLFDGDKTLFLARDIPYNNYARAVTRIRSIAINIEAFCLKAYSNAKRAPLASKTRLRPNTLITDIYSVSSDIIKQRCVDSICLCYSVPRHFLKSCNLYPAYCLFILRIRFIDILMRYNVLVRASRRELIIYSADNLVIYSSAAR